MGHRVVVIHNPVAGWRRKSRLQAVLRILRSSGCLTILHETRFPGEARTISASYDASSADVVVAAGGDGTINEVIDGMGPNAPPLAVIPLGTANVMAIELGLGGNPAHIADAILRGSPSPIYCGRVRGADSTTTGGHRFALMAGVGFDAHVVGNVNTRIKRFMGKGAYVWQTMSEMMRYQIPRYRMTIDGRPYEAASAVVGKSHYYGGPMVCAPDSWMHKPSFQICLFGRGGRLQVLRYGVALMLGRLPMLPDVTLVTGHSVTIEGPSGEPMQADGDLAARLPVTLEMEATPLTVLRPPDKP